MGYSGFVPGKHDAVGGSYSLESPSSPPKGNLSPSMKGVDPFGQPVLVGYSGHVARAKYTAGGSYFSK